MANERRAFLLFLGPSLLYCSSKLRGTRQGCAPGLPPNESSHAEVRTHAMGGTTGMLQLLRLVEDPLRRLRVSSFTLPHPSRGPPFSTPPSLSHFPLKDKLVELAGVVGLVGTVRNCGLNLRK